MLFGDPGQLPPVGANSLWIEISQRDDSCGSLRARVIFLVMIRVGVKNGA